MCRVTVSCSLLLILLLLCSIDIDARRSSDAEERQLRQIWKNIKDTVIKNTVNKFRIDIRHFDKEEMLLFPDVAFQSNDPDGSWKVMIHGWRYEGSRRKDWLGFSTTRWVERIAHQILNRDELLYLNGSLNRDRLRPFFVEDESNELIIVKLGVKTHYAQTDSQGQFYDEIKLTNDEVQELKRQQQQEDKEILTYEAIGDNGDSAKGMIRLMEPREGIAVISDIDDTIKISEVLDKLRLLANTFIHPFKPVSGMAELYQEWRAKHNQMTFHYLSGMPDQLFTLTFEFIQSNHFPDGTFHMRHFGWAASSIFNFLHSQSTFNHKMSYLRFYLGNTIRDYVLVGDSGEKDPEIYGTIAREYPERIRAIFIRAIKGEAFDDARFRTAFEGVPDEKWQVFDDPKQLPRDLTKAPKASAG